MRDWGVVVIVLLILLTTFADVYSNILGSTSSKRIQRDVQIDAEKKKSEFNHFLKYWNLQRQMRTDFQKLLEPCKHKLKWKPYYSERTPDMITSANFSKIQLDVRTAGQYSRLLIQAYSLMNTQKTVGGDTWRIMVKGDNSIPVTTIDNSDGTYEISMLIKDAGYYEIELYLEYTLCDGYKDPPEHWYNVGDEQGKNQPPNTLGGHEQAYLEEKFSTERLAFYVQDSGYSVYNELQHQLKDIDHPSCLMWDGFGQWNKQPVWIPSIPEPYALKSSRKKRNKQGVFMIYGDSVGRRFYLDTMNVSSLCRDVFRECEITVNKIYNTFPGAAPFNGRDLNLTRIKEELEKAMQNSSIFHDENSAFLVNYGLHFVMDIPFSTFIDAMEIIARTLERYQGSYKGTIVWKTTNAMNKWKYGWPDQVKKHDKMQRFLTEQRIELFNAYSTWRMCQSNINVLDIFPMTSSYPFGTGTIDRPYNDSVHFVRETFLAAENYLIDFFNVENKTFF